MALGLVACEAEFDKPVSDNQATFSAGDADFSRFVSIGNSLTSGYADKALYTQGQENSFPNILAGQFSKVGGGTFTQPLMNDNLGGLLLGGNPILNPFDASENLFENRLVLNTQSLPIPMTGSPTTEVTNVLTGPFNNMGVPGAKSFHLLADTYGNPVNLATATANPYYVRFASSPTATIFGDVMAQAPTFYTLWIGNNDILSFATSGGDGVDQNAAGNINPATYGGNDISHAGVVDQVISTMTYALETSGAKGVICNIANVTDIPYFTTVPYAPLDPTDPNFGPQIPTLNAQFSLLNQVFTALGAADRSIVFSETAANAVVIKDESLTNLSTQITATILAVDPTFDIGTATVLGLLYGQARQAKSTDLLVLPSSSIIGKPNANAIAYLEGLGVPSAQAAQLAINGITYPLEDKWVLTPSEQNSISTAQAQYNTSISNAAALHDGLIMVDMKSYLATLNGSGISFNGGQVTSTYASGGGFSLDGVHPTAQGYSLIANKIITKINQEFNANIPTVLPSEYPTIFFE